MPTRDLPGPNSRAWIERDRAQLSPATTRPYPFVMDHGSGAEVWDVDGNRSQPPTRGQGNPGPGRQVSPHVWG
jgi:hypothetical protein